MIEKLYHFKRYENSDENEFSLKQIKFNGVVATLIAATAGTELIINRCIAAFFVESEKKENELISKVIMKITFPTKMQILLSLLKSHFEDLNDYFFLPLAEVSRVYDIRNKLSHSAIADAVHNMKIVREKRMAYFNFSVSLIQPQFLDFVLADMDIEALPLLNKKIWELEEEIKKRTMAEQ